MDGVVIGVFEQHTNSHEPLATPLIKAGQQVLQALNAWLWAQTRQAHYQRDQSYVRTFSAVVLKSRKAHLFHAGDARIYRLSEEGLEQLTDSITRTRNSCMQIGPGSKGTP